MLPDVSIAAGEAHVHVGLPGEPVRDVVAAIASGTRRVSLGVDDALHGTRHRVEGFGGGDALVDQIAVTLANTGAIARDVSDRGAAAARPRPQHRAHVAGAGARRRRCRARRRARPAAAAARQPSSASRECHEVRSLKSLFGVVATENV